jgi:hypothetical protein
MEVPQSVVLVNTTRNQNQNQKNKVSFQNVGIKYKSKTSPQNKTLKPY